MTLKNYNNFRMFSVSRYFYRGVYACVWLFILFDGEYDRFLHEGIQNLEVTPGRSESSRKKSTSAGDDQFLHLEILRDRRAATVRVKTILLTGVLLFKLQEKVSFQDKSQFERDPKKNYSKFRFTARGEDIIEKYIKVYFELVLTITVSCVRCINSLFSR